MRLLAVSRNTPMPADGGLTLPNPTLELTPMYCSALLCAGIKFTLKPFAGFTLPPRLIVAVSVNGCATEIAVRYHAAPTDPIVAGTATTPLPLMAALPFMLHVDDVGATASPFATSAPVYVSAVSVTP